MRRIFAREITYAEPVHDRAVFRLEREKRRAALDQRDDRMGRRGSEHAERIDLHLERRSFDFRKRLGQFFRHVVVDTAEEGERDMVVGRVDPPRLMQPAAESGELRPDVGGNRERTEQSHVSRPGAPFSHRNRRRTR
jgi:hypothetical protein